MNEAKFSIDPQSSIEFSSTFTPGSFQLTNNSDSQDIVSITVDLSSAIFSDLVFDPLGNAGDTTAKGFEFDSQNDEGNTVSIANYPFNDPTVPFSSLHDGGYDVLTIDFDSFQPGQTLRFSADVDPTSVQGADDPGPSNSGSVAGLELVGATVTVKFADDTELTGQVYRTPNSEVASEVTLSATPQAAPEIEAIGFNGAAIVNDANQTIRVTGNAGAEVTLLVVEGGFYTGGGGVDPDPDPFEANRAIAVDELTATIGDEGFVDVPVNLTYTEVDGSGGLNYIVAKYQGNSLISDRVVLEYNPDNTTDPGTSDPQPPVADSVIRIQAEDYKANVEGEANYFDFTEENQGGEYRLNEPVDIEVTGDTGGGFNVAFIQNGEFLTYDVNVAEAGTYNVVLRVASPSTTTQSAEVTINGQNYVVDFDPTGGWQEYTDVVVANVNLSAGIQELRFDARSSEFNLNYIELVAGEPVADTTAPTAVLDTASASTVVGTADAPIITITYSDDTALEPTTIDANDLTVTAPDGTEMAVSLIDVDAGVATYAIAAPGGAWDLAEAGDYTVALKANEVSDTSGNSAAATELGSFSVYFVDPDEPTTNPGAIRIEAEEYKAGTNGTEYFDFDVENRSGEYRLGEPVDIEATTDVGGGFNVSFIQSGEYLTYDVNVPEAGNYNVVLRVATPSDTTQAAEVTINGQTYSASFDSTGGWQEYIDLQVANVNLEAGTQELRFDARSSEFNLNYIELVAGEPGTNVDTTPPTAVLNTTTVATSVDGTAAVNFTVTYGDDTALDPTTIDANDLTVTAPDGTEVAVSLVGVDAGVATYGIAAPGGAWDLAEAGDYTVALKANEVSDASGNSAAATELGSFNVNFVDEPETPVTDSVIRLQAEDYKAGTNGTEYFDFTEENQGGEYRLGEPVDIEATTDVGGGFNVAFIQSGEYLTYDVNVPEAGNYNVVLRVATPSETTQAAEVTINGQTYSASFDSTGGWQEYIDLQVANVNLEAGTQELRFDARSSEFNLNYIELVAGEPGTNVDTTPPTAVLNTTTVATSVDGTAAVNFTVTYGDDTALDPTTIDANDLTVTAPDGTEVAVSLVGVDAGVATYGIAAPNGTWNTSEAGGYTVSLKEGEVNDTSGNSATAAVLGTVNLTVTGEVVPAETIRIEAEDYDTGMNGIAYLDTSSGNYGGKYRYDHVDIEATSDADGSFNVSSIQAGEFLNYSLDVAEAGNYDVVLRVATPADAQSLDLTLGGQTVTANFDSTGGWQSYQDVVVSNINLDAGSQKLRLDMKSDKFNLNYIELVPKQNPGDKTAPTAVLNTPFVSTVVGTDDAPIFTVTYSDDTAIDETTVNANDLTVTAPDGAEMAVSLVGVDGGVATYALAAPGDAWDLAEAGDYTVSLKAGEVSDTSGNFVAASELGSFNVYFVDEPSTDTTPPTAVLGTATVSQSVDSTTAATFNVTYSDDTAIDSTTIDANDLTVTAPDGTEVVVSLVGVNAGVATYALAAPNGAWTAADAGAYAIAVKQGEIADSSGNAIEAAELGSVELNVSEAPTTETIRVEAEDYKAGTNGTEYFDFNVENFGNAYRLEEPVDIEVTGDVDGDFNVGFIQSGEFLTYDINVPEAGDYNIVLRVAANEDAQSLEIVAGDETYTANFDFTGGWQTYTDVVIPNVTLNAGAQELRLNATSSAFNINYFDLTPAGEDETAPTAALGTTNLTKLPDSNTPANFTVNFADNVAIDAATIDGNDVTVTAPDGTVLATTLTAIDNDSNGNPQSAIYYFDAPDSTWDAADIGNYSVNLNVDEVADTNGNFAAAANLGSFELDVATPVDDGAIRINAGADADFVDSNNRLWQADANFTGGQVSTVGDAIDNTSNTSTSDAFVYQSQRSAADSFNYSIPVEDGNYIVNLHLAELDFGDAGFRQFDVSLEEDLVLDDYDIWANTKNAQRDGGDTAKVQQLSDSLVVRDGAIDLDFTSVANNATIAGIEILPIEGAQALILESGEGTLVSEGGNSDTYQVLLNSQPTADVTINLQPDAQATVDQNTLTFTPENWSVPQTVTINAIDDDVSENFSSPATISHTISTTDSAYANVEIDDINLQVIDNDTADAEIKFDQKVLNINLGGKTTGAWGPDGRFYVGSRDGIINAYTFDDNYNVTNVQEITTLQNLPNHEILGIAFNPFENDGSELKLYVSHSELYANEYTYPKNGGTGFDELVDFSPYSGEVSVLSGPDFSQREIVVDNLGVSNHDHGINGLAFDGNGDLLIAVGSNTNAGIPDDEIGGLDESPFTAAIVKAEITKPDFNGNIQYQLPADWVAPEGLQVDPLTSQGFGGIVDVAPGVDVSVYASGLRNSYDLVYSTKGILYATENDANPGFGDYSTSATTQEFFDIDTQNEINIVEEGKYYGNPNRNRGRQDDRQNKYYPSYEPSNGDYTSPIKQHGAHIHGVTEYRSTTFSEQLRGDLLTIELDANGGTVMNVELTADGREVENMVGLKTEANGGENLTQGLDVVTGFGGSIIGINYFGDVTAAIPVTDNITTATAYEIDEWRAPASGGGTFTIGGVNFSELGDTTVTIGNETAEIISVSDKRIFGTLPAFGAEYTDDGLLDITVNSGGEVSTITDAFQPLFV